MHTRLCFSSKGNAWPLRVPMMSALVPVNGHRLINGIHTPKIEVAIYFGKIALEAQALTVIVILRQPWHQARHAIVIRQISMIQVPSAPLWALNGSCAPARAVSCF
jgi:hypothetical protein